MSRDAIGKVQRDVGDVLEAVEVGLPRGDHALGLQADQVVHDGKIVWGQIPDDVDVVLEQSKVHASGVVVVETAQHVLIDELLHLSDGPGEQERVVHHDGQILPFGELDQVLCLR